MLDPNREVMAGAAVVRLKPGVGGSRLKREVLPRVLEPAGCGVESVCHVFTPRTGRGFSVRQKKRGRDRVYHVELDVPLDPFELAGILRQNEEVEKADPIYLKQLCKTPTRAKRYPLQWGLRAMDCEKAWDVTTGSRDIRVAIIDSGVQTDHPDLKVNAIAGRTTVPKMLPKLIEGYRWVGAYGPDTAPLDAHGHGTHVAGVVGAAGRREVVGVNWKCSIMALRVFAMWEEIRTGRRGVTSTDGWVADAIDWAVAAGARVLNLSLGGYSGMSFELEEAIDDALEAGVILCAAAGNEKTRRRHYPSAKKGVWGIAAHDRNGKRADFSNYGKTNVMFMAPGVDIWSTLPGDGYGALSGTSMACPHVAGLSALLLANEPGLDREKLLERLRGASDKAGKLSAAKAIADTD